MFCGEQALGNPCGVVFLDEWLDSSKLLNITRSLSQPVTSFIVENALGYSIRWFSNTAEINLCGHGSLGAAAAILEKTGEERVLLQSQYGDIEITQQDSFYQMELPAWTPEFIHHGIDYQELNIDPIEVYATRDLVLVVESEQAVRDFIPNHAWFEKFADYHALIVTAQSDSYEYVLRYFAPRIGIPEDLATGSAQCSLAPFWFSKLSAHNLKVRQLSSAGGVFEVSFKDESTIRLSAQAMKRKA
ncbi:hypothetical protein PE36_00945 [Moritella sp. PE36]|uniref:PhzF family phenazine biosynthesis protein n=1 Tax=Moritella sp. PE36 TaxID=58051 RepID=UPI0001568EED|nr:PhzF family phenazine biosynthesis protein [Moritella sp. PE36]EDM66211.1 hypothetical protein PE36_00945 [Moritella sp. PE36]